MEKKFCSKCGSPIDLETGKCTCCKSTEKKLKNAITVATVVLVVLCLVCVGLLLFIDSNDKNKVSGAVYIELENGDYSLVDIEFENKADANDIQSADVLEDGTFSLYLEDGEYDFVVYYDGKEEYRETINTKDTDVRFDEIIIGDKKANKSNKKKNETTSKEQKDKYSGYKDLLLSYVDEYPCSKKPYIKEANYTSSMHIGKSLDEVGYCLIDLDSNGQDELLISECNKDEPLIYEMYTICNGKIIQLAYSEPNNYYMLKNDNTLYHLGLGNDGASFAYDIYVIGNSGSTLVIEQRIAMDSMYAMQQGYKPENGCYFVSESSDYSDYVHVSETEGENKLSIMQSDFAHVEYIPLSNVK